MVDISPAVFKTVCGRPQTFAQVHLRPPTFALAASGSQMTAKPAAWLAASLRPGLTPVRCRHDPQTVFWTVCGPPCLACASASGRRPRCPARGTTSLSR